MRHTQNFTIALARLERLTHYPLLREQIEHANDFDSMVRLISLYRDELESPHHITCKAPKLHRKEPPLYYLRFAASCNQTHKNHFTLHVNKRIVSACLNAKK